MRKNNRLEKIKEEQEDGLRERINKRLRMLRKRRKKKRQEERKKKEQRNKKEKN